MKKIAREKFEIRVAHSRSDLAIYYELHRATHQRSGRPAHEFVYYEHIYDRFVSRGLCRVVFFIQRGEILAAHNTVIFKGGAHYWTAASKLAKANGANRALMDEQIMFAKHAGCDWFEAGEAFPQLVDGKYKGISDYKKNWGSALYPFYKGRTVTWPKLRLALDLLQALRG